MNNSAAYVLASNVALQTVLNYIQEQLDMLVRTATEFSLIYNRLIYQQFFYWRVLLQMFWNLKIDLFCVGTLDLRTSYFLSVAI